MLESNKIEGEDGLNPNDMQVISRMMVCGINNISSILTTHRLLTEHLKVGWSGCWRSCLVTVGSYVPPSPELIPSLMQDFVDKWDDMDSWEAHNAFEKIHPFEDFNGRMGRLIWLSKAVTKGYSFKIPFLQTYYYQTLGRGEIK